MRRILQALFFILLFNQIYPQHNSGENCISCHNHFVLGGTVFTGFETSVTQHGIPLVLIKENGSQTVLNSSDSNGNISETIIENGNYIIKLGDMQSRTWHNLPDQRSCNSCHTGGLVPDGVDSKKLPQYHTRVTPGNNCKDCHHFPATMNINQLIVPGKLTATGTQMDIPGSNVIINNVAYSFDPAEHTIETTRDDIFAPGHFSMFDVILAVAEKNGIAIDYYYDDTRKTHFVNTVDGVVADYWYHFSYDIARGVSGELGYRRENRWDEALWRPGVWIQLVTGEDVDELKAEYLEEIQRESTFGNRISQIKINISPSNYQGNPPGSGRINISKNFADIAISAHNMRSSNNVAMYSKPFQPGVITTLDAMLSLEDQGYLDLVTAAFYTYFGGNYIDSHYIVELGFPSEGIAHSSGRQGFVYSAGNGSNFILANQADNKMHITSDISVLHAPEFMRWRWIELGNPYYESVLTGMENLILEDYAAIDRGFNLHPIYPNPVTGGPVSICYNLFEPGKVKIQIFSLDGHLIEIVEDRQVNTIGVHEINWEPSASNSGVSLIIMQFNQHKQVRRLIRL